MVSTLASPSKVVQWRGGIRRSELRYLRQSLDAERVFMTSQLANYFAANVEIIVHELALITLEWVFAAVCKLVSGQGATLGKAVLALLTLV